MRVSTRAVSATGSPRPSWEPDLSMTSGYPPSSATPIEKLERVRVLGLSKSTATPCGPAKGWR